jgi:hypothetical protein
MNARVIPAFLPLTTDELVSDALLHDLASGGPERAMGEISPEHTAQLVMVLPDLCGELLARRATQNLPDGVSKPDDTHLATGAPSPQTGPGRLFFTSCRGRSARGGVAATHENDAPAKTLAPDADMRGVQSALAHWMAAALCLALFFVIALASGIPQ